MGWITISYPDDPMLEKKLQRLLDEGKQDWEIALEHKQGRPNPIKDQQFDDAREGDSHR